MLICSWPVAEAPSVEMTGPEPEVALAGLHDLRTTSAAPATSPAASNPFCAPVTARQRPGAPPRHRAPGYITDVIDQGSTYTMKRRSR